MMYLFHNVYGDADYLINSASEDIQCVPFGWTPEIEEARNTLINQLNVTVSALPSVVFQMPEKTMPGLCLVDNEYQPCEQVVPEHWEEIRVMDLPEPKDWTIINQRIQDLKAATKHYPDPPKNYYWDAQLNDWILQN